MCAGKNTDWVLYTIWFGEDEGVHNFRTGQTNQLSLRGEMGQLNAVQPILSYM